MLFRKLAKKNVREPYDSDALTPRETELLMLLLKGCTLSRSAAEMGIKYSTANTHQNSIYRKLGVNSRAELMIRCKDRI